MRRESKSDTDRDRWAELRLEPQLHRRIDYDSPSPPSAVPPLAAISDYRERTPPIRRQRARRAWYQPLRHRGCRSRPLTSPALKNPLLIASAAQNLRRPKW